MSFALFTSFWLGVLAPTTALCVLPLVPGYLAYLANRASQRPLFIGGMIVAGIVSFMLLFGVLFSTVLQVALNPVIGIISPLAFILLLVLSLLLIFNVDLSNYLPHMNRKEAGGFFEPFLYGFFFGAIIIPCNPGIISAFLARAFLFANPVANVLNFVAFGLGMGFPILVLAVLSQAKAKAVVSFLTRHKKIINVLTGLLMLCISLYYLFIVFKIHEVIL